MANLSKQERKQFEKLIRQSAARYEVQPEYWINGDDDSLSYCYDCAVKRVAELQAMVSPADPETAEEYHVGGGYGWDDDSRAFCETCQTPLDTTFTDYGCEQELDYFEEDGLVLTSAEDCYSFELILATCFWDGHETERINAVAAKALAELVEVRD